MLNECRKMYSLRACLNTQAQARYESENVLVVSWLSVATPDEILVIQLRQQHCACVIMFLLLKRA